MRNEQTSNTRRFSRRQSLQLGLGIAAGMSTVSSLPLLPAASSDHQEILVDADRLEGFRSDPDLKLVSFMSAQDFEENSIPESVQLDWPELEVTDTSDESIAQWQDQVSKTFASLGITRDRAVIAYDDGTLFAARLWWILHYFGHEDNYVINGGLAAWQHLTLVASPVATSATVLASPAAKEFQPEPRTNALAPFDEVLESLDDSKTMFVDARTPEEYAAGHIPGAVNINYPLNAREGMPRFWKPADELRSMYDLAGITPEKRIIPYCSSGVRSAVTFFTLKLIGYEDVGLYTGSWNEWEQRPDAPITKGDQP